MGTFIGVIVVIALFCAYSYFAYRISFRFRPLNKAFEELEKQRRELDSARTTEIEKEPSQDPEEKSDDMPQTRD